MVTNKIRPYKSQTNHRRQTCDTVNVAQMGVLDVESCCLHGAKAALDLPTSLICRNGQLRPAIADKNLKFGPSIGVLQHSSCNIDMLTLEQKQLVVDTLMSGFETMEQMPYPDILARPGIPQPKVLLDAEVISDAHIVE